MASDDMDDVMVVNGIVVANIEEEVEKDGWRTMDGGHHRGRGGGLDGVEVQ